MRALRFDDEQRFTCQRCGRCCRRGWDIAVSAEEVEAYRRAHAERWFREEESGPEGAAREPFEPIPGAPSHFRIRKRADGACGFLSPDNLCRIHEEMGTERKPLTCRLFPFRFHPGDPVPVLTASFACPTVVGGTGETLGAQAREIAALRAAWERSAPGPTVPLELAAGRPVVEPVLARLREALAAILERPGAEGTVDLAANLTLVARLVDDLGRRRVLELADDALAEYVGLTGRHAARPGVAVAPRPPSALGRLLFRGFVFLVVGGRTQVEWRPARGLRLGLRWRLARLLAHFHGLGPAVGDYDLRAARRAPLDLTDPPVADLIRRYLRSAVATLGTGEGPVLEELSVSAAFLSAGLLRARMLAALAQRAQPVAADLEQGLLEAADMRHAQAGAYSRFLATLSGGGDAFAILAAGGAKRAEYSALSRGR